MVECAEPDAGVAMREDARLGVQPSGFLLAVSSDWRVSCASDNLADFIGIDAADVLGRPLSDFLTPEAVHLIRNRVALLRGEDSLDRLIDRQLTPDGPPLDAMLHLSGGAVILEGVAGADPGGIDVAGAAERMLQRVERLTDVEAIAETATRELRGLTGFDSIEIYRNGARAPQCIASFVRSGLSAFEPAQVRPAALERPLWIAENGAEPVPILCSAEDGEKLSPALLALPEPELADAIGRTGARSAMLLPIAGTDAPWGFALALHRAARAPRVARLSVAELFTHMLGLRIQLLGGRS